VARPTGRSRRPWTFPPLMSPAANCMAALKTNNATRLLRELQTMRPDHRYQPGQSIDHGHAVDTLNVAIGLSTVSIKPSSTQRES
jgi:hypothetical protein